MPTVFIYLLFPHPCIFTSLNFHKKCDSFLLSYLLFFLSIFSDYSTTSIISFHLCLYLCFLLFFPLSSSPRDFRPSSCRLACCWSSQCESTRCLHSCTLPVPASVPAQQTVVGASRCSSWCKTAQNCTKQSQRSANMLHSIIIADFSLDLIAIFLFVFCFCFVLRFCLFCIAFFVPFFLLFTVSFFFSPKKRLKKFLTCLHQRLQIRRCQGQIWQCWSSPRPNELLRSH